MKLWALPQEFEVVCRDIWALHLKLLSDPPSAEPYHFALELRDGDINERGSDKTGVKDKKNVEEGESEEDESHSEEEEGLEEKSRDEELEALLRANSDLEDSSDDYGENAEQPLKHERKTKGRRRQISQSPASNIAVLIVGCWTLRVPALCRDFSRQVDQDRVRWMPVLTCEVVRLIELYELPYLDPIQRRLLPESMVVHLTKHNAQAMSPYVRFLELNLNL
ncbi:hypothetical protein C0992_000810 [Termitomyces sp. T32_za158]|nr:hypothetical protein C0992_000810 [Termitomyces sp. T32_za158]